MEVTSRVVELARLEGVDALTAGFVELATRLGIEEFADFESTILGIANEAVRRCLEIELQRRADDFGEAVAVDGVEHRRHQDGAVGYHSLCGLLRVRRANYRQIGVLDGPTVIPLEVAAGILANATPALAYSVTQNFAVMPLRHYEQEMKAAHRQVPSRSTLERVGKRIGDLIQATLPIIEPIVRAAEQLPAQTASISIGVDRTTVPMAERRPGAGGPRRSRTKPYARQPPDAIDVAYRMAYVATVALHDASGNELVTKRYAATPEEDPDQLIDRVFAEVAHLRAQQPSLPFTVVQDGAPEMWNLVQGGVDRHQMRPRNELIDRFHVDERLAALSIIVSSGPLSAYRLRTRWQRLLDRSDAGIDRICRFLRRLEFFYLFGTIDGDVFPKAWRDKVRQRLRNSDDRRDFDSHTTYLFRNCQRMRYASARRAGFPIGSGVTEGACKSVVTTRFKTKWPTLVRTRAVSLPGVARAPSE